MPRLLRVTVLMKRQAHLSPEEFRRYWKDVHGPLFLSISLVDKCLVRYSRFYAEDDHVIRAATKGWCLPSVERQSNGSEWDGCAEFWARSIEDLETLFSSEEYRDKIGRDEYNFLDKEKSRTLIGWEDDEGVKAAQ